VVATCLGVLAVVVAGGPSAAGDIAFDAGRWQRERPVFNFYVPSARARMSKDLVRSLLSSRPSRSDVERMLGHRTQNASERKWSWHVGTSRWIA